MSFFILKFYSSNLFEIILAIIQNTSLYNFTEIYRQNQHYATLEDNVRFILFTGTGHIFAGIDSTGFKITHESEYYIPAEQNY